MPSEPSPPALLQIVFGDSAPAAHHLATARLLLWSDAFDAWLEWRRQSSGSEVYYTSHLHWRRLLHERRKMPWELAQSDIEAHAAWMLDREYSASKVNDVLGVISNFYRWCSQHEVDPACPPDFNPAAAAPRIQIRKYARAVVLSQDEIRLLLDFLGSDESPLGRRDYALILARLRLGMSLKNLLALRWGQIHKEFPPDVLTAIQAALTVAGRLPGMHPESYIFAPLADPFKESDHNRPEDWAEERPLANNAVLNSLKRYGVRLGIPAHKLTLRTLRHTATRLRLDEGYTLEEMKAFLDSTEKPAQTAFRLRRLPPLPRSARSEWSGRNAPPEPNDQNSPQERKGRNAPPEPNDQNSPQERKGRNAPTAPVAPPAPLAPIRPPLPRRRLARIKPGDNLVHGMYARTQPPEAVAAVLAEDLHGIEEELVGLRSLARSLLEPPTAARKSVDAAQITAAYTQAASRLAVMIDAEKELSKEREEDTRAQDILKMFDNVSQKRGEPPVSPDMLAEVYGEDAYLGIADRRLMEEIAATRYVLRSTLALASAELKPSATIRLVEVYGEGCVRLVRLLKAGLGGGSRLAARFDEAMEQAIDQVTQEWGLAEPDPTGPDDDPASPGM